MLTHTDHSLDHGVARGANPYVFVVGCARSGTTLLQRMLDHHPDLAVANDTHFIPWALESEGSGNPAMTEDLARRVVGYRRFHRFGLQEADVANAAREAENYAEFVGRLYDIFGRRHGKRLAGEKTPEYVRHLPTLAHLFPKARFIHITRDGRDVALSVMKWAVKDRPPDETGCKLRGPARRALWADEPLGATALWWAEQVLNGAAAGDALGPARYREVSYERLVADPRRTLSDLAAFLELPDAPEMAAYHEGKQRERLAGQSAKKAWLPATKGLRDWRNQMSGEDAALFEALAGDALRRFEYPTEHDTCRVKDRALSCRRLWAEETRRSATAPGRLVSKAQA